MCVSLISTKKEKEKKKLIPYECDEYATLCLSVVREEKLSVLLQLHVTSKTDMSLTQI